MVQDYVRRVVILVGKASTKDVPGSEGSGRVAPTGDVVPVSWVNTPPRNVGSIEVRCSRNRRGFLGLVAI